MLYSLLKQATQCVKMTILCAFAIPVAQAQSTRNANKPPQGQEEYTAVEQMPRFDGNLNEWLANNLRYPEAARKRRQQGRVVVRFTISETGRVENVTVAKSAAPALDAEAVRLVRSMPRWKPGIDHGVPVSVHFTLPINFSLE